MDLFPISGQSLELSASFTLSLDTPQVVTTGDVFQLGIKLSDFTPTSASAQTTNIALSDRETAASAVELTATTNTDEETEEIQNTTTTTTSFYIYPVYLTADNTYEVPANRSLSCTGAVTVLPDQQLCDIELSFSELSPSSSSDGYFYLLVQRLDPLDPSSSFKDLVLSVPFVLSRPRTAPPPPLPSTAPPPLPFPVAAPASAPPFTPGRTRPSGGSGSSLQPPALLSSFRRSMTGPPSPVDGALVRQGSGSSSGFGGSPSSTAGSSSSSPPSISSSTGVREVDANLFQAVTSNTLEAVTRAVAAGANVNAVDLENASALHRAAGCGNALIVRMLLDHQASVHQCDKYFVTPLHRAAQAGHSDVLKLLLDFGASQFEVDERGRTPLLLAFEHNHPAAASALLQAAASYEDDINNNEEAADESKSVAKLVEMTDNIGQTCVHWACNHSNIESLQLLISYGANINVKDAKHRTPIGIACRQRSFPCVSTLLKAGIVVDASTNCEIVEAAATGQDIIVSALIDAGFDPNTEDAKGNTALHKAIESRSSMTVDALIRAGADTCKQNAQGQSPLHIAAVTGSVALVNALQQANAEIDSTDDVERSPLHVACLLGHSDVTKLLIDCQANFNLCDSNGASPLHLAVGAGKELCARMLMEAGAAPDVEDDRKRTTLHHAVPHPDLVEKLLDAGADINAADDEGMTPLASALMGRHEDSIRILVLRGAAINVPQSVLDDLATDAYINRIYNDACAERRRMQDVRLQKQYSKVVQKFNSKPKEGLKLLLATKSLEASTPADVARFLHNARGLNKKKIGELIGSKDEFHQELLKAFMEYMDLSKLDFDLALRLVLSRFILPGESQMIDRIMCQFAGKFHKDNPDIFPHEDVAYMLAFSLILLNTDLHSKQIKKEKKMTKEQFIRNSTGLPGFPDLPHPYLEEMYNRIAQNEIKMDQAYSGAYKQGYLEKIKGKKSKGQGRRWMVLKDKTLFWFKTDQDAFEACDPKTVKKAQKPPPTLDLNGIVLRDGPIKALQFEIVMPDGSTHIFQAADEAERAQWMVAICDVVPEAAEQSASSPPLTSRGSNISLNSQASSSSIALAATSSSSSSSSSSLLLSPDQAPGAPLELPSTINFETLNRLASMCSLGAKSNLSEIRRLYGQGAVIEAPVRGVNICLLILPAQKRQYVIFTGTKWDNAMTLKHDLASCSPGEYAKYYELFLISKTHVDNAKKFLKKDLPIQLVGHSIGGCVALLASEIFKQMKFKIESVTTFGQPAVLLPADLDVFKKVKLTRIRIDTDPIPLLFPGCRQVGFELVLLGDNQFTYAKPGQALPSSLYPVLSGEDLIDSRLSYHHIDYYCRALFQRQSESVGVSLSK